MQADGTMRDRIFLRDHVRKIEIGAFEEEVGVTQRVRFSVALEVDRLAPDAADDESAVVSYDLITEAIAAVAAGPRIKLLETFAERLAARLLDTPKVHAAHIVLEKLDRVSGSLGVEMTRRRG